MVETSLPGRAALLLVCMLAPAAAGCASRAAPFDQLDQAQVTIYKITMAQPTQPMPGQPGAAANPWLQMLPPELQPMGQELLKQAQQLGIPTLPPIPGLTQPTQPTMPQQQMPLFRGQWQIVDQRPVMDEAMRERLLDLFGEAESFNNRPAQCFTPGMAVSFQAPNMVEPVDVVVSLNCNAVNGFGFVWPHPNSYGMQPQTNQTLAGIYQSLFGPIPPSGA